MSAWALAANLARVAGNQASRIGRHAAKRAQRVWRGGRRELTSSVRAVEGATADTLALPGRVSKAAHRAQKRAERFREHVVEPWLEQRDIEGELAALARGTDPIVVGPWLSEVGYEVLYWRPFLLWMLDRYRISPDRVIAVSRGGVSDWYKGIAGRYVELLGLFEPADFAARNSARQGGGDQKQLASAAFDAEILERVAARHLNGRTPRVCHPSLLFRLFRRFWFGDRSLDFFLNHVRFERMDPPSCPVEGLPREFAAVKFYTGAAVPDTSQHRELLRSVVARVAEQMPVVALDTGLRLDEHRDFLFEGISNVKTVAEYMTPSANLAVQTAVIGRASMFVGTCGGLAWLAPMIGTRTVAVYADDRFLAPHLFVARHAFRLMKAAPFTTIDLTALNELDLGHGYRHGYNSAALITAAKGNPRA